MNTAHACSFQSWCPLLVSQCLQSNYTINRKVTLAAFPLWGKTPVSGEKPQAGPGVGQGRIGAELGTSGMKYNATITMKKCNRYIALL